MIGTRLEPCERGSEGKWCEYVAYDDQVAPREVQPRIASRSANSQCGQGTITLIVVDG